MNASRSWYSAIHFSLKKSPFQFKNRFPAQKNETKSYKFHSIWSSIESLILRIISRDNSPVPISTYFNYYLLDYVIYYASVNINDLKSEIDKAYMQLFCHFRQLLVYAKETWEFWSTKKWKSIWVMFWIDCFLWYKI